MSIDAHPLRSIIESAFDDRKLLADKSVIARSNK